MERDVMDIIKDKEFIELTAAERAELGELCSSEEEFDQVKSMFAGMSVMDWSNPTPKAETKASLDHLFAQKHPKAAPIWYNAPLAVIAPKGKPFYRQPLIQAAAVGLLIFLAYPLVNSNVMESKTNQVASLEEEMTSSETQTEGPMKKEALEGSSEIDANEVEEVVIEEKSEVSEIISEPVMEDILATPMPKAAVVSATPSNPTFGDASATSSLLAKRQEKDASLRGGLASGLGAAKPGSTHPDGVFIADRAEVFSAPASQEPAVFDLLTSTF